MPELNEQACPFSQCPWCGGSVSTSDVSCPACGAYVRLSRRTSASGWTELAPIQDMTRLRIGNSTCQIEGNYVPVADFNLDAADSVYFAHHVLLWKDPLVRIRRMAMPAAYNSILAGPPIFMTNAQGPGHIAFSGDEPGETIAIPLEHGAGVDVRGSLFLAATSRITYASKHSNIWFTTQLGEETETHYPIGQFIDHFRAVDGPGLLLLHASGNVFIRDLAERQIILIKPNALVYTSPSMTRGLMMDYPANYKWISHRVMWLRLIGPGRVAVQSAYKPVEDNGRTITGMSQAY